MLSVCVTFLLAVCVVDSKSRKNRQTNANFFGAKCLRAHAKGECFAVTDSEGNGRCHWTQGDEGGPFCSMIEYATIQSIMTTAATKTTTTTTTTTTQEVMQDSGCCYPNESVADKWTSSCIMALTEQDCAEVTEGGDQLCYWQPEEAGDGSDCAKTTTPPLLGCCYGSGQGECAYYEDQVTCERRKCAWIETEDPLDCVLAMTTTSAPSTTDEPGCCVHRGNERRNMVCEDLGSQKCEHVGSCEWFSEEDPECAQGCCTSTDSEETAKACSRMATKSGCAATEGCEFRAGQTECEWPTAEDTETTTEAAWIAGIEPLLFEEERESEVVRSLSSLSLSGVVLSMICAIVTFTALAVYRRRDYIKVADASAVTNRAQMRYDSV